MQYLVVSKKNNPLFVWGWDRKIRPLQSPIGITQQALWCQLVILRMDFSSPPSYSWRILINSNFDIYRNAIILKFSLSLPLFTYFLYIRSNGSVTTAHMCRLIWAFIACQYVMNVKFVLTSPYQSCADPGNFSGWGLMPDGQKTVVTFFLNILLVLNVFYSSMVLT